VKVSDHELVEPKANGDVDRHRQAVARQHVEVAVYLLHPRFINLDLVPRKNEPRALAIHPGGVGAAEKTVPLDGNMSRRNGHADPWPERDKDEYRDDRRKADGKAVAIICSR